MISVEIYSWLKDEWRSNSSLSGAMILRLTPFVFFSINRMVGIQYHNFTNIVKTMNFFLFELLRSHWPDYRSDLAKCDNASFIRSFIRPDIGSGFLYIYYIAYPSHTVRPFWPKTKLGGGVGRGTWERSCGYGVVDSEARMKGNGSHALNCPCQLHGTCASMS